MPYGRGCPPGRDFKQNDCRQLKKSWKFGRIGKYKGFLPKCFLWGGKHVFYNRGGRVPPTKSKYGHKAICKKKRRSTTTTTTTILPTGDSSHIWSISSKDQFDQLGTLSSRKKREHVGIFPMSANPKSNLCHCSRRRNLDLKSFKSFQMTWKVSTWPEKLSDGIWNRKDFM